MGVGVHASSMNMNQKASRRQTATFSVLGSARLVPVQSTTTTVSIGSFVRGFVDSFSVWQISRRSIARRSLRVRFGLTRGEASFLKINQPCHDRNRIASGFVSFVHRGNEGRFGDAGYSVRYDDADARSSVSGGAETVGGVARLGRGGCAVRQL